MCDPIWQVTLRIAVIWSSINSYTGPFTCNNNNNNDNNNNVSLATIALVHGVLCVYKKIPQDMDDWNLRIKESTGQPSFIWKTSIKTVCVRV